MSKGQKENSTIKIGEIELPVNQTPGGYVPSETNIIGNVVELETIALGVRDNLPVLLIGDTGSGKTSFIRHLAYLTGNGFRRLNLNGSTTADELVGHYIAKDKAMVFVKGVLYEAMEKGEWILLDELNAGLPEVLFVLQSVLDDDKFLVVSEDQGQIVRCHPNFRLFATMNPSLEYAGTRDLNKALLSRFPIVIQTHYPDAVHEIEIIKSHVPTVKDEDVTVMVKIAEDIRKAKKADTIGFICSTRELINWAKLTEVVGLKVAAELAVLNKCELESDRKTVEDLFKMQIGKWEKKEVLTLTEIERQLSELRAEASKVDKVVKAKDAIIDQQDKELASYRKVAGMKLPKAATEQAPF